MNENGNPTHQDPWDKTKETLRGKFMALEVFTKTPEKSQINNLCVFSCFITRKLKKRKTDSKWIIYQRNYTKNKWKEELVLYKQDWLTHTWLTKKSENLQPNNIQDEKQCYSWYHRNTKDY